MTKYIGMVGIIEHRENFSLTLNRNRFFACAQNDMIGSTQNNKAKRALRMTWEEVLRITIQRECLKWYDKDIRKRDKENS